MNQENKQIKKNLKQNNYLLKVNREFEAIETQMDMLYKAKNLQKKEPNIKVLTNDKLLSKYIVLQNRQTNLYDDLMKNGGNLEVKKFNHLIERAVSNNDILQTKIMCLEFKLENGPYWNESRMNSYLQDVENNREFQENLHEPLDPKRKVDLVKTSENNTSVNSHKQSKLGKISRMFRKNNNKIHTKNTKVLQSEKETKAYALKI